MNIGFGFPLASSPAPAVGCSVGRVVTGPLLACRAPGRARSLLLLGALLSPLLVLTGCGHARKKIGNSYPIDVEPEKDKLVFTYPNGVETTRLHVPQGRPVRLMLPQRSNKSAPISASEFHAVGFTLRPHGQRALDIAITKPPRTRTWRLLFKPATGPAVAARVVVDTQVNFPAWLKDKNELYVDANTHQPLPMDEVGEGLIENMGCLMCHTTDGSVGLAPTWKNLAGAPVKLANGKTVIANYNYLRHAILHAGHPIVKNFAGVMPNFHDQLGGPHHAGRKLNAIIWYINKQSKTANLASRPPGPDVAGGGAATMK